MSWNPIRSICLTTSLTASSRSTVTTAESNPSSAASGMRRTNAAAAAVGSRTSASWACRLAEHRRLPVLLVPLAEHADDRELLGVRLRRLLASRSSETCSNSLRSTSRSSAGIGRNRTRTASRFRADSSARVSLLADLAVAPPEEPRQVEGLGRARADLQPESSAPAPPRHRHRSRSPIGRAGIRGRSPRGRRRARTAAPRSAGRGRSRSPARPTTRGRPRPCRPGSPCRYSRTTGSATATCSSAAILPSASAVSLMLPPHGRPRSAPAPCGSAPAWRRSSSPWARGDRPAYPRRSSSYFGWTMILRSRSSSWKRFTIARSTPRPTARLRTSANVPTTTPMSVSAVRTFCCRIAEKARPQRSAARGRSTRGRRAHETTRPSFSRTMRSAAWRASSSSWVTMISVVPSRRR